MKGSFFLLKISRDSVAIYLEEASNKSNAVSRDPQIKELHEVLP